MKTFFSTLILATLFLACNNATSNQKEDAPAQEPAATQQAVAPSLPGLPIEKLQDLWNRCDFIDIVFYDLPISMSMDEKSSIQALLRQIAADPAPQPPNCKPAGRVSYQVEGENELEADIYFNQGCTYYVFLEDGKPAYANLMMPEGIYYFNSTIQQAGLEAPVRQ